MARFRSASSDIGIMIDMDSDSPQHTGQGRVARASSWSWWGPHTRFPHPLIRSRGVSTLSVNRAWKWQWALTHDLKAARNQSGTMALAYIFSPRRQPSTRLICLCKSVHDGGHVMRCASSEGPEFAEATGTHLVFVIPHVDWWHELMAATVSVCGFCSCLCMSWDAVLTNRPSGLWGLLNAGVIQVHHSVVGEICAMQFKHHVGYLLDCGATREVESELFIILIFHSVNELDSPERVRRECRLLTPLKAFHWKQTKQNRQNMNIQSP